MSIFQIKDRFSGSVMFECELSAEIAGQSFGLQLGFAIKKAVETKAYLRDADLSSADLSSADLSDAYLRGAYLRGANLSDANLSDANLGGANLSGADLGGADLGGAYLGGAYLGGAYLGGAYLGGAYLGGADLRDAYLQSFKQDLIAEVLRMPDELEALRDTIIAGKIDGSSYSGECACLAGTLARAHGIDRYRGDSIDIGPLVFTANAHSPREIWFSAINVGDTPENNAAAKAALEWVNEAIAIRDHIRGVKSVPVEA